MTEREIAIATLTSAITQMARVIGTENTATCLQAIGEKYIAELKRKADALAALTAERDALLCEQAHATGAVH